MSSQPITEHPYNAPALALNQRPASEKARSESISSVNEKRQPSPAPAQDVVLDDEESASIKAKKETWAKRRPFVLGAIALVILGWWISSMVIIRERWIVSTVWAWFFLLIIAFRFIPNTVITRPVEAVWKPVIEKPFFSLSYPVRLGMGVLALLAVIFGSAFGFKPSAGTTYGDRAISVLGLFVFQTGFYLSSVNRSAIDWPTVLVGLFAQQAIALFVLKTSAGFDIFKWIASLAADFLNMAHPAAQFFFDAETIRKYWFFVNTLSAIIFFIAFVQMMYYLGVMQWVIGKFAWFFFKIMNVSGAEAVVAAGSPWVGQGESACLVRPFVSLMTPSEIHLTMTSGFSTIAGSVLSAYIGMGVPPENLVTASVMSIPASIAISKLRYPETEEPVTRGQVTIDRGKEKNRPANVLHAFSKGAVFGLVIAGHIFTNVLTVLALVFTIDGLLTWIGKGFAIQELTLRLILGYVFYPVTFLLGVPRREILVISRLLAQKLVVNEFAAYLSLKDIHAATPLTHRGYTIASYALCGFANLGSVGIQIGVLSAMAPNQGKVISRLAVSAMICGFISTLQAAGIAGMLV